MYEKWIDQFLAAIALSCLQVAKAAYLCYKISPNALPGLLPISQTPKLKALESNGAQIGAHDAKSQLANNKRNYTVLRKIYFEEQAWEDPGT